MAERLHSLSTWAGITTGALIVLNNVLGLGLTQAEIDAAAGVVASIILGAAYAHGKALSAPKAPPAAPAAGQ